MKLYMHPVSMTSRPVRLFIAEHNIPVEEVTVDLMKGDHYKPPFTTINPNRQVPVLEDEGFRLTESSAILKYLADKANSPAYPKDLKQRAKVNEMMDWLNTQFYREYGYGFIYPQIFPQIHKRPTEAAQQVAVDLVRRGGKVVLGGRTPNKVIPFIMDKLSSRGITMIGVRAHEPQDVRTALALISARRDVLEKSGGVELSLKKADLALRLIGQEVPGQETLHVALNPWSD